MPTIAYYSADMLNVSSMAQILDKPNVDLEWERKFILVIKNMFNPDWKYNL